jgi:hypothetical protein
MLAVAVVATMVAMTSTAQADFTVDVLDVVETFDFCTEVVVDDNEVTGGCLIEEWDATVNWYGAVEHNWIEGCHFDFDARIDGAGNFYIDHSASTYWLCDSGYPPRRMPCLDDSTEIPWAGQLRAVGQDELEADVEICTRVPYNPTYPDIYEDLTFTVDRSSGDLELTQLGTYQPPGCGWCGHVGDSSMIANGDEVSINIMSN